MERQIKQILKLFLFLSFLIGFWQALYSFHFWPSWLFPSPRAVLNVMINGFNKGTFIQGILISLKRLFIGLGVSIAIGTVLGFLIAKIKLLGETLGFLLLGLQTLPSICWLPLALLWFGLNERAIIFVIVMGATLSITISVEAAVKNIPPIFINAGRMLGAEKFNLYRYIIIPAILPSYITGIKHGWSFAWRSLMSGEMLFITAGLGQLLMFGRELNDMAQVMAIMIIIVIVGAIFDQLIFGVIENQLRCRWGLQR